MTEKLDLVCQHASKDRGAATTGRVANQERQRIERSEVIQSGQVLAARQVGGRETDQTSQRNCRTSRDGTRGRLYRLCRSEFDTRGLDQKQTTLEQLKDGPKLVSATEATQYRSSDSLEGRRSIQLSYERTFHNFSHCKDLRYVELHTASSSIARLMEWLVHSRSKISNGRVGYGLPLEHGSSEPPRCGQFSSMPGLPSSIVVMRS